LWLCQRGEHWSFTASPVSTCDCWRLSGADQLVLAKRVRSTLCSCSGVKSAEVCLVRLLCR
jgi:hypothetical protein